MKRPFSRREKIILAVGCGLAVMFAAGRFIGRPLIEFIQGHGRRLETEVQRIQRIEKTLKQAKAVEPRHENYLRQLRQDASDEAVFSRLLTDIQTVSSQTGLNVSDLKPLRVEENKHYRTFPVSVSFDASTPAALEFIDRLQKEPYRFDVPDWRMEQAQRKGSEIKVRLTAARIFVQDSSQEERNK